MLFFRNQQIINDKNENDCTNDDEMLKILNITIICKKNVIDKRTTISKIILKIFLLLHKLNITITINKRNKFMIIIIKINELNIAIK